MPKSKFILTTFLTIIFYNLARILGQKFFTSSWWWKRINNDQWHHYQLGLLLIIVAVILLKKKKFLKELLLAVGIGMVIDESMYLLYPLNHAFSHYNLIGIIFEFIVFVVFSLTLLRYGKSF